MDDACKSKGTRWNNDKLANVKVPSIPTSAACCDDVQLTKCGILFLYLYNRQLLHRTASSKHSYLQHIYNCQPTSSDCVLLNTDTSSYLQPSITPSDCVLLQAADVGILGTFTFASLSLFHLVPLLLQASSNLVPFLF